MFCFTGLGKADHGDLGDATVWVSICTKYSPLICLLTLCLCPFCFQKKKNITIRSTVRLFLGSL